MNCTCFDSLFISFIQVNRGTNLLISMYYLIIFKACCQKDLGLFRGVDLFVRREFVSSVWVVNNLLITIVCRKV